MANNNNYLEKKRGADWVFDCQLVRKSDGQPENLTGFSIVAAYGVELGKPKLGNLTSVITDAVNGRYRMSLASSLTLNLPNKLIIEVKTISSGGIVDYIVEELEIRVIGNLTDE